MPDESLTTTMLIRPANPKDASEILSIYEPIVRDTIISFELEVPSLDEMRQRIETIGRAYPWLVAVQNDQVSGYAYASRHRERPAYQWSVDVSAYVAEGARGSGVGRKLYNCLFTMLVELSYYTAYAGIALPNPASVGLHEAFGFRQIGVYNNVGYKLGAWHNVGWWQLQLQPYPKYPPAPQPMAQYLKTNPRTEWLVPDVPPK